MPGEPLQISSFLNDIFSCLNHCVRWILTSANPPVGQTGMDWSVYGQCAHLISEAGSYNSICSGYITWRQGFSIPKVDVEHKIIDFLAPDIDFFRQRYFEVSTIIATTQASQKTGADFEKEKAQRLHSLRPCVKMVDEDFFQYSLDQETRNLYDRLADSVFDGVLPEMQKIELEKGYTVGDLLKVYKALFFICIITSDCRLVCGAKGNGVGSSTIVSTSEELVSILAETGIVDVEKIKRALDLMTFNPNDFRSDLRIKPVIAVGSVRMIFPQALIHNDFERNILSLLLAVNQAAYNRFSPKKEQIELESLKKKFQLIKSFCVLTNVKLESNLPDIDLAVLDIENKYLGIFEVKSLLAPVAMSQFKSKEQDLRKGQEQLAKINAYFSGGTEKFIKEKFGIDGAKFEAWFALISESFIGSSIKNYQFKILHPNWIFVCLSLEGNLRRTAQIIESTEVLPKLEVDFEPCSKKVQYAGYTFIVHGFRTMAGSKFFPGIASENSQDNNDK